MLKDVGRSSFDVPAIDAHLNELPISCLTADAFCFPLHTQFGTALFKSGANSLLASEHLNHLQNSSILSYFGGDAIYVKVISP